MFTVFIRRWLYSLIDRVLHIGERTVTSLQLANQSWEFIAGMNKHVLYSISCERVRALDLCTNIYSAKKCFGLFFPLLLLSLLSLSFYCRFSFFVRLYMLSMLFVAFVFSSGLYKNAHREPPPFSFINDCTCKNNN